MIMRTLSAFVIALCVGACSPAPSTDATRALASDATTAERDTAPSLDQTSADADGSSTVPTDGDASHPAEDDASTEAPREQADAVDANADAVDASTLAALEPPPTPEEIEALIAAHGAPSQDELFRQARSVGVAFDTNERRLGERLLVGRWQLSDDSRDALNDARGDAPPLTTMTLRFDANGNIAMLMELGEDRFLDRGRWQLEGMYGAEVRVIVTSDVASPRRERMLFLHIDRLILSPQDEALIFERRMP